MIKVNKRKTDDTSFGVVWKPLKGSGKYNLCDIIGYLGYTKTGYSFKVLDNLDGMIKFHRYKLDGKRVDSIISSVVGDVLKGDYHG